MADYECRLKEYRRRKGLTQLQLAQQVGTHRDVIGLVERGRRKPSPRLALAVSQAVDAPIEEIFIFPQNNPRSP